jgi:hypothetical protein
VRWSGWVQPRFSGTYTFYGTSSDNIRIFVNNKEIVDVQASKKDDDIEGRGTITLTAGQKYRIVVEFYQKDKDKDASVRLEWSSPQQTREVIPKSQLYVTP